LEIGETERLRAIRSFEDLEVWQKSKTLTLQIYQIANHFPKDEVYGITSQIKRAALSVPANIAEGFGRYHFLDKAKFYLNARGSLYELKSHLIIAKELQFIKGDNIADMLQIIEELSLQMNNLIKATRKLRKNEKDETRD
jgi:four helix bundle protein